MGQKAKSTGYLIFPETKLLLLKKFFNYCFNSVLVEEKLKLSAQSIPLLLLNVSLPLYEFGRSFYLFNIYFVHSTQSYVEEPL